MSEKKNAANAAGTEKVMTNYDRKIQKRKEEAEKARREERRSLILGIAVVIALAVFVLSFPVRTYLAVHGTYIKVGGEKVSQVEFDYNYAVAMNTYITEMGNYLSMFGFTDAASMESEQYNETMTFADYFAQLAAETIAETRGIKAIAEAEGFTYDASAEVAEMKAGFEETAAASGLSMKDYLLNVYGPLATWDRLEGLLEESAYVSAYLEQVVERNEPTEEEITAEYESNKDTYDSVDYHLTTIEAQLPTTAPDGTVETDEEGNEIPYEPTEEEVEAAMAEAYKLAEAALETIAEEGEEYINKSVESVNYLVKDFLFDESRKSGDKTIIESTVGNAYLVVSFDKRYLDESNTYDIRAIITSTTESQTILDEWNAGEATEESFIELVAAYDEAGSVEGLYSGLNAASMDAALAVWLTEEGRTEGDTTAIITESGNYYTIYYKGVNEPSWKLTAENTILNTKMLAFMEDATKDMEIEDPKGKLVYLQTESEASQKTVEDSEAEESTGEAN